MANVERSGRWTYCIVDGMLLGAFGRYFGIALATIRGGDEAMPIAADGSLGGPSRTLVSR